MQFLIEFHDFNKVPEPELLSDGEYYNEMGKLQDIWDDEGKSEEIQFDQSEQDFFISLTDAIPLKHKIDDALDIGNWQLSFSLINGKDGINPNIGAESVIRSITTYVCDDDYYIVNVWEGYDSGTKSYRCDGYECWEKFLKEIFQDYSELISKGNKTNESLFDEVPEPRSLLDENGDIITGASRLHQNRLEPFDSQEKLFINKLLETLNEEYISTNFSDPAQFILSMGEMGENTHYLRVIKMEDDYYQVEYINHVDSDDEYVVSECDGFKCLSNLLTRLFAKIKEDYGDSEFSNYLEESNSNEFGFDFPQKITKREYNELEIKEYDQYGAEVKLAAINRSDFRRLSSAIDQTKYLISLHQFIGIHSRKSKFNSMEFYLQILYFKPKDDAPYYLIHTVENEEEEIKEYYMAETFDEIINFCKEKLK